MSSQHPDPPTRAGLVQVAEVCEFCQAPITGAGTDPHSAGRDADRVRDTHLADAHPAAYAKAHALPTPPPATVGTDNREEH